MELDTDTSVSLVSERTWQKQLQEVSLQQTDITPRTYTEEWITILGQVLVKVENGK